MDFYQKTWGLRPIEKNIPSELKKQPRWVCFRAALKTNGSGKVDKFPINPHNPSRNASTNRSESWGSFDQAMKSYESHGLSGIGFVITELAGYIFIDLDDCLPLDTGEIKPWALGIVKTLNTYTELSPSGTGLRIILKGAQPGPDFNNHQAGIEMYGGGSSRYLTITGHRLSDSPAEICKVEANLITEIYDKYCTANMSKTVGEFVETPIPDQDAPDPSSLDLPDHIKNYLIQGDASGYNNDGSAALMGTVQTLYNRGLSDEEVLGIIEKSPGAMETGRKRRGNNQGALNWIWKYSCIKTRPETPESSIDNAPAEAPKQIKTSIPPDESIFNVSGVLQEAMNYISKFGSYPQPIFSLGAAVAMLSLLIGNRYKTEDDLYCNIFCIAIGPTGCGKDAPRKAIKRVLQEYGYAINVAEGIASGPALEDYLKFLGETRPEAILLLDEIGKLLQQLTGRDGDEHGIIAILLRMYTAVDSFYNKRIKAGERPVNIQNPFVTLYGTSTADAIHKAFSESDTEAGFIGRFLFLATDQARPQYQGARISGIPEELTKWIDCTTTQKDVITVRYLKPAKIALDKYLSKIDDYLRSVTINPITRAASVRLVEMAKKLALISAVSRKPDKPSINLDDVRWAIALVEHSKAYIESELVEAIENGGAVSLESQQITKCLDTVKRVRSYHDKEFKPATTKGFMPKRLLQKKMRLKAATFSQIVNSLLESGEIRQVTLSQETHAIKCKTAYFIPEAKQ